MAADETAKLEAKVVAARVRLMDSVKGLDDALWEWRPEDGRWSVRMTLAHVGSAQRGHLEVARRLVTGEQMEMLGFDLDDWNAEQVAQRAAWSVEQVLAELEAVQAETLAFLGKLDAQDLALSGFHPALGQINVGQVLRIIAVHDALHRRDILQLLKEVDRH